MIERIAKMKMKGDYETSWKVLESEGTDSHEQQIQGALQTMEWMRDTAPKILAKLAGDHHKTMGERIGSSDKNTRNNAFSSVMRTASVRKNTMFDNLLSAPLLESKIQGGKEMSDADYANKLKTNLQNALKRQLPAQDLDKVIAQLDKEYAEDEAKRAQIDAFIKGEASKTANPSPSELAEFNKESVFADVFAEMRHYIGLMN